MTAWYLAVRLLGNFRRFFNLSTTLSILGMAIGVACLVVSMAIFSGYVSTLERILQDALGHLLVLKRASVDRQEMLNDIRPIVKGLVAETPFVYAEAILANKGQVSVVMVEGIEEETIHKVLNLKERIIEGSADLSENSNKDAPNAIVGRGIAQKFKLKLGDTIRIVLPMKTEFDAGNMQPKLGKFTVSGVINYGHSDFDARYVVVSMPVLQEFAETGSRITGYRLRLQDPYKAKDAALEIANKFGTSYWARDWQDVNRTLFEAAKLEKAVIFFVLMILVVAAAFNIANTLSISVVQRYRDISVLKTLGAGDPLIRRVFTAQGLIVGAVGSLLGTAVGLGLCRAFEWIQVTYQIIPAEVYKLDHIDLDIRLLDLLAIIGASLVVCYVATLIPSRRGAKISPVEGLRYE